MSSDESSLQGSAADTTGVPTSTRESGAAALLEMREISRRFPGVQALDHVDLRVRSGEIHAILGENGAGKSTLMRILAGAERADEGEILIDGQPVHISSPHDAIVRGISMVYQETNLAPHLSVA